MPSETPEPGKRYRVTWVFETSSGTGSGNYGPLTEEEADAWITLLMDHKTPLRIARHELTAQNGYHDA